MPENRVRFFYRIASTHFRHWHNAGPVYECVRPICPRYHESVCGKCGATAHTVITSQRCAARPRDVYVHRMNLDESLVVVSTLLPLLVCFRVICMLFDYGISVGAADLSGYQLGAHRSACPIRQ